MLGKHSYMLFIFNIRYRMCSWILLSFRSLFFLWNWCKRMCYSFYSYKLFNWLLFGFSNLYCLCIRRLSLYQCIRCQYLLYCKYNQHWLLISWYSLYLMYCSRSIFLYISYCNTYCLYNWIFFNCSCHWYCSLLCIMSY